jgi:hypothetical protein
VHSTDRFYQSTARPTPRSPLGEQVCCIQKNLHLASNTFSQFLEYWFLTCSFSRPRSDTLSTTPPFTRKKILLSSKRLYTYKKDTHLFVSTSSMPNIRFHVSFEDFMALSAQNEVFLVVTSVLLQAGIDVSDERVASIFRAKVCKVWDRLSKGPS